MDKIWEAREGGLVVIVFYVTWCGPCKGIAWQIERMATIHYTDVIFTKVDTDVSEDIAREYKITALPTFIFVKDGVKVDELMGANREQLEKRINKHKSRNISLNYYLFNTK